MVRQHHRPMHSDLSEHQRMNQLILGGCQILKQTSVRKVEVQAGKYCWGICGVT